MKERFSSCLQSVVSWLLGITGMERPHAYVMVIRPAKIEKEALGRALYPKAPAAQSFEPDPYS